MSLFPTMLLHVILFSAVDDAYQLYEKFNVPTASQDEKKLLIIECCHELACTDKLIKTLEECTQQISIFIKPPCNQSSLSTFLERLKIVRRWKILTDILLNTCEPLLPQITLYDKPVSDNVVASVVKDWLGKELRPSVLVDYNSEEATIPSKSDNDQKNRLSCAQCAVIYPSNTTCKESLELIKKITLDLNIDGSCFQYFADATECKILNGQKVLVMFMTVDVFLRIKPYSFDFLLVNIDVNDFTSYVQLKAMLMKAKPLNTTFVQNLHHEVPVLLFFLFY